MAQIFCLKFHISQSLVREQKAKNGAADVLKQALQKRLGHKFQKKFGVQRYISASFSSKITHTQGKTLCHFKEYPTRLNSAITPSVRLCPELNPPPSSRNRTSQCTRGIKPRCNREGQPSMRMFPGKHSINSTKTHRATRGHFQHSLTSPALTKTPKRPGKMHEFKEARVQRRQGTTISAFLFTLAAAEAPASIANGMADGARPFVASLNHPRAISATPTPPPQS
eukprot:327137-Hanusia_phi.AAC.3